MENITVKKNDLLNILKENRKKLEEARKNK